MDGRRREPDRVNADYVTFLGGLVLIGIGVVTGLMFAWGVGRR